jgi:quinol monooxygenase YgiN
MADIYVFGTYTVREGFEERVYASLSEHEQRTRTEAGCLHASVSRDLDDPRALFTMQRWADQEALDVHRALPHVVALSEGAGESLDGPFTLVTLVRQPT